MSPLSCRSPPAPTQCPQPIPRLKALSTLSHPTPYRQEGIAVHKGETTHLGRPVPGATHNDAPSAIHTVHLLFMSRVLDSEGAMNLMNANLPISRRETGSPKANYSLCRKRTSLQKQAESPVMSKFAVLDNSAQQGAKL